VALNDDLDTGCPVVLLLSDWLFFGSLFISWASLMAQMVKILCIAGDLDSIPGSGISLEKGMATHSRVLAGKISWTEEPCRLQSMGLQQSWT